MCCLKVIIITYISLCAGQVEKQNVPNVRNSLTSKIGNFSIEILYHTVKEQENKNVIVSPFTIWTTLAVISEGARDLTRRQINHAIRISAKNKDKNRIEFKNIAQWLTVKTNTIDLSKENIMLVNDDFSPHRDYQELAKLNYDVKVWPTNFTNSELAATNLNTYIKNVTKGLITNIVDSQAFKNSPMVLASAIYFKGQWTVPFNVTNTLAMPFFDENNKKIGQVNMMYNRHTYAFSNMRQLQARVVELPYGAENRLSMLIMLPHNGVMLENMFRNFLTTPLDAFFEELRLSKEEYADDEVDCFIPRFKIESSIDLTDTLKQKFGIYDMFDPDYALLPLVARTPVHVSKLVHKAVIEVVEEGTSAAAVTVAEFSNRMGVIRFEVNKPFAYMIVEKVTNSIVFGGVYRHPSLY